MGNRIVILMLIISGALGYTIYEAMKLNSKLGQAANGAQAVTIRVLPQELILTDFNSGSSYDFSKELNQKHKIFVHFWATWCGPCEVEFPELVEMINHFAKDSSVKFYLIAVNDEDKKITKFLKKFKIDNENVVILVDKNDQYQRFGTYKLPESYLFEPNGNLIKRFEGQQPWMQQYIIDTFK